MQMCRHDLQTNINIIFKYQFSDIHKESFVGELLNYVIIRTTNTGNNLKLLTIAHSETNGCANT